MAGTAEGSLEKGHTMQGSPSISTFRKLLWDALRSREAQVRNLGFLGDVPAYSRWTSAFRGFS